MKLLGIIVAVAGAMGFATVPGVASADPTDSGCAHIGTIGPDGDGQPALECQKVDDPANPQQWVTIPDLVVGNPCPMDWLGQTHDAVGLKCALVGGIPRWEQA